MKKITKCSLLGVSFCLSLGGLVLAASRNNFKTAKADGSWSETLTPSDLIVNYAVAVDDDSSVNSVDAESGRYSYFTRHGNLQKSKIAKFDGVTIIDLESTGDKVKFTSSTATDCWMNNWKINMNGGKTGDNTEDGGILGITAKEPLAISFEIDAVAGWLNGGSINWYLQKSGSSTYTQIDTSKNPAKGTRVVSEAVNLSVGDTFYWEFIQYYGGGNIEKLPTFTIEEQIVLPWEESLTTENLIKNYANAVAADDSADFAETMNGVQYSVRHGNVASKTISKFDHVETTGGSVGVRFYNEIDGGVDSNKAEIQWGRNQYTTLKDGVLLLVKAPTTMTFSVEGGVNTGWGENGYINYSILRADNTVDVKKSTQLTASNANFTEASALNDVVLYAGDTMIWEFTFEWSGRRNIQGTACPTFHFGTVNIGTARAAIDEFIIDNMHFADVEKTDMGTGKCTTEGWYATAKAAFNELSSVARELFATEDIYADALERLQAWAAANGESLDSSYVLGTNSSMNMIKVLENNSIIALVAMLASVSSLLVLTFFIIKKRKHN